MKKFYKAIISSAMAVSLITTSFILPATAATTDSTSAGAVSAQSQTTVYTVAYNANGGKGTMANTYITYGIPTKLRSNAFTRTGYTFSGWNAYRESDQKWLYVSPDASSSRWYKKNDKSIPSGWIMGTYKNGVSVSQSTAVNNDTVIMYAKWTANKYTVLYNANGGRGSMANTTVTYGVPTALSSNAFTRPGYVFAGWNGYRESDQKWLYVSPDNKTSRWYKENDASILSGWIKDTYKNSASVSQTTSVNNDKVTMYAVWLLSGDVDMEGSVNITDATLIQLYLSGSVSLNNNQLIAADVNRDGKVNGNDITYLQNYFHVEANKIYLGDVDCDGDVDSDDVNCVQSYISGKVSLNNIQLIAADANCDGVINIADVTHIQHNSLKVYRGDLDMDGNIDDNDVKLLQNYVSHKGSLNTRQIIAADVNQNGKVDVSDVTYLQGNMFDLTTKWVLLGDVDLDGDIDNDDVVCVQNYVSELVKLDRNQLVAADANCDGAVNTADVTYIQKNVF